MTVKLPYKACKNNTSCDSLSMSNGDESTMQYCRDLSAGKEPRHCQHCGSTGSKQLDSELTRMVHNLAEVEHKDLLIEMLFTSIRSTQADLSAAELKMLNRSLKELVTAAGTFAKWRHKRKVSIFGSARITAHEPAYKSAKELAELLAEAGFMVITGAGPGIMQAGNEGAGRDNSFGLNIVLPFENKANPWIAADSKLLSFNYFFTRKLFFVKEADALVCLPGGFGTMDEIFETLTLIQTGKAPIRPIVMLDSPNKSFWHIWQHFIQEELLDSKLISPADMSLFMHTQDPQVALNEIVNFYKVFHSYRFVDNLLVIRINKCLDEVQLQQLNAEFSDIVKSGRIEHSCALPKEQDEHELRNLSRLVFRFVRGQFGRLRQMINKINSFG